MHLPNLGQRIRRHQYTVFILPVETDGEMKVFTPTNILPFLDDIIGGLLERKDSGSCLTLKLNKIVSVKIYQQTGALIFVLK